MTLTITNTIETKEQTEAATTTVIGTIIITLNK